MSLSFVELQVNVTCFCLVLVDVKRSIKLPSEPGIDEVLLKISECQVQVRLTPSSAEEQFSFTQHSPFSELELTICMVGFWSFSAEV